MTYRVYRPDCGETADDARPCQADDVREAARIFAQRVWSDSDYLPVVDLVVIEADDTEWNVTVDVELVPEFFRADLDTARRERDEVVKTLDATRIDWRVRVEVIMRERDEARREVKQMRSRLARIATIITCSGAPSRTGVTKDIAIDEIIKVLQGAEDNVLVEQLATLTAERDEARREVERMRLTETERQWLQVARITVAHALADNPHIDPAPILVVLDRLLAVDALVAAESERARRPVDKRPLNHELAFLIECAIEDAAKPDDPITLISSDLMLALLVEIRDARAARLTDDDLKILSALRSEVDEFGIGTWEDEEQNAQCRRETLRLLDRLLEAAAVNEVAK